MVNMWTNGRNHLIIPARPRVNQIVYFSRSIAATLSHLEDGVRYRSYDSARQYDHLPWNILGSGLWQYTNGTSDYASPSGIQQPDCHVEPFATVGIGWFDSRRASTPKTGHAKISNSSCHPRTYSGRGVQRCVHRTEKIAADAAARQETVQNRNTQIGHLLHRLLESCSWNVDLISVELIYFFVTFLPLIRMDNY